MVSLPEFKAGRAQICKLDRVNDQGAGTIYYVSMPDGHLVDCGIGSYGEERARIISDCVNMLAKWADYWPPSGYIPNVIASDIQAEREMSVHPTPRGGE